MNDPNVGEQIFMLKSTGHILLKQTLYKRTHELIDGELWQRFDPIQWFYEREDGTIMKFPRIPKDIRDDLEYIGEL